MENTLEGIQSPGNFCPCEGMGQEVGGSHKVRGTLLGGLPNKIGITGRKPHFLTTILDKGPLQLILKILHDLSIQLYHTS